MTLKRWEFKGRKSKIWTVCAIAPVSFAAGSLITARLVQMESRFRDTTSRLLAKHDLKVVGYWVPEGAPAWDNTFIFIVAHSSREKAKKNWDGFRADPEFQEVLKAEQANKTVEKIDETYMRPTDFSPMK